MRQKKSGRLLLITMFVGSATELQKMLKQQEKEINNTEDT